MFSSCLCHLLALQLCTCAALVTSNQPSSAATDIPKQIITTGWPESFDDLKSSVKGNVNNMLALNPGFTLRYLGDVGCYNYLEELAAGSPEFADLVDYYRHETLGMLRGDMCRAAVLFKEGGYYLDLDIALQTSLAEIAPPSVDFTSSVSIDGSVLNAIQIAPPLHPILLKSLKALIRRYKSANHEGDVGVLALTDAFKEFQAESCPQTELFSKELMQVEITNCGGHTIKMFKERYCNNTANGCPGQRASKDIQSAGIYDGERVMMWSRFEGCNDRGCTSAYTQSHWVTSSINPDGTVKDLENAVQDAAAQDATAGFLASELAAAAIDAFQRVMSHMRFN